MYQWASDTLLQRLAQISLFTLACIGGADYLMPQPRGSLNALEHLLPLRAVGALFLFFGVMGLIGECWIEIGRKTSPGLRIPYVCSAENRWWPSYVAHFALCTSYLAFTFAYLAEMFVHWHLWGDRYPAFLFSVAVTHGAFAQKRKNDALP